MSAVQAVQEEEAARRAIRFVASSDGVPIATARHGHGPLVLKAATWLTHIDQVTTGTIQQALIDEFSATGTYVEYDTRGCGLSQRRVGDISFEAWVRDLEAVADAHGGDEPFTLLGFTCGAGVAVEYAARHPGRVRNLVLLGGCAIVERHHRQTITAVTTQMLTVYGEAENAITAMATNATSDDIGHHAVAEYHEVSHRAFSGLANRSITAWRLILPFWFLGSRLSIWKRSGIM